MSQTEQTRDPAADVPPSRSTPAGTRVDTAHLRPGDTSMSETPPAQPSESNVVEIVQQVRSQAAQLAAHLQRQQTAVDHREAELNARNAAIENQVRSARLWLAEQHADIAERQAEADRRGKEIAQREAELVLRAKPMLQQKTLSEQAAPEENESADRTAELDRRQAELDALAERLADRLAMAEKTEDAQHALRALEKRRENLERAEKLLSSEQSELERQRRQLAEERITFGEQSQALRQRLASEQQRAIAENDKTWRELKRQSDELAARQAVLERLRADLARAQQEALEIRLATEELWARLCGTMAPAALTRSLAQIRLKLAEEQRLSRVELAEQKTEVLALSARLAEQHQKLAQRREDLQEWAKERQKELEKQAGLLVNGQRQIEEERDGFQEKTQEWQNERFRLQQEIRRLLRQLNRAEAMAA